MPHISIDTAPGRYDIEIRLSELDQGHPVALFVKSMVSSRYSAAKNVWTCHARELRGFKEYLDAVDFISRDASEEALARILQWGGLADIDFRVKSGDFNADIDPRALADVKTTLYPDQKTGVRFLISKQRAVLADSMGIGKSLQALASFVALRQLKLARYGLIVMLGTTKAGWAKEVGKHTQDLTFTVLPAKRKEIVETIIEYRANPTDLLFIHYDALSAPGEKKSFGATHTQELSNPIIEALLDCQFDAIYADEAHSLKNTNTRRYKCFQYFLSQVRASEPQVEVEYLTESNEKITRIVSGSASFHLDIGDVVDVL